MPFYIYLGFALLIGVGLWAIQCYVENRNIRIAEMCLRILPYSTISSFSYSNWLWGRRVQVTHSLHEASHQPVVVETGVQNASPLANRGSYNPQQPTLEQVDGYTIYRPPENLSDANAVGIGIPASLPMYFGRAPHPVQTTQVEIFPLLAPEDGQFFPARIELATNLPVDPRRGKSGAKYRNLYFSDFVAVDDVIGILILGKPKRVMVIHSAYHGFIAAFGCLPGTHVRKGANLLLLGGVRSPHVVRAQSVGILAKPKDMSMPPAGSPLTGDFHLATVYALGGLEFEKIVTPFPCRVLRQYVDFGNGVEFNQEVFLLEKL